MALLTRYLFELRVVEYFFRDNLEIDSIVLLYQIMHRNFLWLAAIIVAF